VSAAQDSAHGAAHRAAHKAAHKAARTADRVWVSVIDDGPGIPPEELPHVFDRFWRGGKVRAEGSGLGLAIARELVRAHGGEILVESKPDQGTTFRFSLPLRSGL
jgi:signal transduction histidine kinase